MIEFDVQMLVVLVLIATTIALFVSEIVSIDVAALSILAVLGLLTLVPGFEEIIEPQYLYIGFASNAVISIMAIMIIGESLDRVGVMRNVANAISRYGGRTETRITTLVCSTVAIISSFMQNVGAAALYIPVVARLSAKTEIPIARLLMPMGFCAIMGGTLTMVGSSPLILLNDLLDQLNTNLPEANRLPHLDLFAVTPIGICLVVAGVLYFLTIGRSSLPRTTRDYEFGETRVSDRIKNAYRLDPDVYIVDLPSAHALVGKTVGAIENSSNVHIVAVGFKRHTEIAPTRDYEIRKEASLAIVGPDDAVANFASANQLHAKRSKEHSRDLIREDEVGFCEIVIPAESKLIGKSISDIWLRRSYQLAGIGINRGESVYNGQIRQVELEAGDTLLTFSRYNAFANLQKNRDFIPITAIPETGDEPAGKAPLALGFLAVSLLLIISTNLMLSQCLWVGALGMILTRIISIEQAYAAISWKTIFLLASLMPLGRVVETSGTAAWIAQNMATFLEGAGPLVAQALLAVVATFFTLVMSNVGATVLLVPLAVNLATSLGADPLQFALIVAISTSNSFLIPTHQVNVLIMGPGGYRVKDFMRTGGVLTVIFIAVELAAVNTFF